MEIFRGRFVWLPVFCDQRSRRNLSRYYNVQAQRWLQSLRGPADPQDDLAAYERLAERYRLICCDKPFSRPAEVTELCRRVSHFMRAQWDQWNGRHANGVGAAMTAHVARLAGPAAMARLHRKKERVLADTASLHVVDAHGGVRDVVQLRSAREVADTRGPATNRIQERTEVRTGDGTAWQRDIRNRQEHQTTTRDYSRADGLRAARPLPQVAPTGDGGEYREDDLALEAALVAST